MQRMIADCWMQSQERRPTMKEAVKLLRDQFEKERKNYEKSKKAKKKSDTESGSGPQTAHTGNLEALIERGQQDQRPIIASEIGVSKADDVAEADKVRRSATPIVDDVYWWCCC
jgi:translation initiation factor IF-2